MRRWSETADLVSGTRRTSEKVDLVAAYLRSLEPDDLAPAAVFFSGRPFAECDARTTGLGWAAISEAAEEVAGSGPGEMGRSYDRSSDVGTAVGDLLADAGHVPPGEPPTLREVAAAFSRLAETRGAAAKRGVYRDLLTRCDPLVARFVTRILTGDLRIGFREGHLEAAIARAFGRQPAEVQWAGMLTGDIGRTALAARDDALADARLSLFHALKPMLASAVADEAEVISRMTPPVWVEDKYDGIRAQLHRRGDRVRLYSRDLRDVTGQFPELADAARALAWDGILDGEILAWRDGAALPFLQLQTRLGRKAPSERLRTEVPVIFVAFDLLAWRASGEASLAAGHEADHEPDHEPGHEAPIEPLLRLPLRERRRRLEALRLRDTPGFGLAALVSAPDEAELRAIFEASQARGNEGLVVKDPDSAYSPGRRGYAWLKIKKALTTLDCVVVGVEVGHGRRHGVLSDYTFAVIDDRPGAVAGRLVTIGKAYSGLTDAQIAAMTGWFEAHTLEHRGRYRVVEPSVVVEIAFDVVQRSARHASGFALRFPRIVRIRDDKSAREADRLSTVEAISERLGAGGRYGVLGGGGRVAWPGPTGEGRPPEGLVAP